MAQGVDVTADVNNNAAIPFEPGKKYRIRFINMSALSSKCYIASASVNFNANQGLCCC